jgi:hypothetical protein
LKFDITVAMNDSNTDDIFLSKAHVRRLTGRAQRESQIEVLRAQGVPFFVDGTGWPVVARAAIEGRRNAPAPEQPKKGWVPRVLSTA